MIQTNQVLDLKFKSNESFVKGFLNLVNLITKKKPQE